MKNVTITVEDSVLEWARVEAARRGTSVSRMLGDFMAELQRREDSYERAYLAWRTDERGWQAQVRPVPRSLSSSCGTCVFFKTEALEDAASLQTPELEQIVRERENGYEVLYTAAEYAEV